MKIGQTIRILRTARKTSQGNLARQLGVTAGYLSLVEQDKREPSLGFLERVGDFFEIPVGFLFLSETAAKQANPKHQQLINEIRHAMLDYVLHRPELEPRRLHRSAKK